MFELGLCIAWLPYDDRIEANRGRKQTEYQRNTLYLHSLATHSLDCFSLSVVSYKTPVVLFILQ